MKALRYDPVGSGYSALVMVDKITHLNKSSDGEYTYIHLTSGETLVSNDSLNIEA